MSGKRLGWAGVWVLCGLIWGCGSSTVLIRHVDSPSHHVSNGMRMLELQKTDDAYREFSRAADLDPRYAPAHVGLALVYGARGAFDEGLKALASAGRHVRGKSQEMALHVGTMRFYAAGKAELGGDWLDCVEKAFREARFVDFADPEPFYHMAMAYKTAHRYDLAARYFFRVMEMGEAFSKKASAEYASLESRVGP